MPKHLPSNLWSIRNLALAAGVTGAAGVALPAAESVAQDACCYQPAYRLQCETVMEPRVETAYRTVYETVFEPREVTETRMVLKTRTEEREYQVARPQVETSYRVEQYTVTRPVLETSYEEQQVTTTRMVAETSEREEQYTTYRPVVETSYQEQQCQVQRPVVETQYQTQSYTTLRPVTTVQNQTVDAGGYVAQQVVTPGTVGYGLQWVPRAYQTTGPFGLLSVNRGGLFWTPTVTPPTVQTQLAYRPNYITQQVAQTSYVPETVQQQVPVQVQRMQTETVTQRIPVQTTRLEPTVEVRRVPVTVQRPVTETTTHKVPVQRQRYVQETKTRRVPVHETKMVYETRKEPVTIQYYEPETVTKTVTVRRQVAKLEPYQRTVMVPRQVVQRVAPSYYDPFGSAISSGYSLMPSYEAPAIITSPPTTGSTVIEPEPEPAADAAPQAGIQRVESKRVQAEPSEGETEEADDATAASPSDDVTEVPADEGDDATEGETEPSDQDKVKQPALNEARNATPASLRRSPAFPRSAREVRYVYHR